MKTNSLANWLLEDNLVEAQKYITESTFEEDLKGIKEKITGIVESLTSKAIDRVATVFGDKEVSKVKIDTDKIVAEILKVYKRSNDITETATIIFDDVVKGVKTVKDLKNRPGLEDAIGDEVCNITSNTTPNRAELLLKRQIPAYTKLEELLKEYIKVESNLAKSEKVSEKESKESEKSREAGKEKFSKFAAWKAKKSMNESEEEEEGEKEEMEVDVKKLIKLIAKLDKYAEKLEDETLEKIVGEFEKLAGIEDEEEKEEGKKED